jgi:cell division protease FtsH
MAATNRGDLLDPALLRPGRFDRRIMLDLPDKEGRLAILEVHKKNKPFVEDLDWEKVAKRTVGFSGADLENMLNEAAILAARAAKVKIDMADIEEAATKVKLGPQKKRLQSDFDKKITAYHEAGHAIVTHFLPHMDPVHRISIVSRGMSLGHTLIPPAADRLHETRSHLVEQIASMMGGRAAEELIFSEMTTGAASDIQQATAIAREMVMEFGMSALGPINFGPEPQQYMGRTFLEPQRLSDDMAAKIDLTVAKIIDDGYKLATTLLKKYKKILDKIAAKLVEVETLEGEQFEELVGHPKVALAKAHA